LAYTSDIPPPTNLQETCDIGNEVSGVGIKFLPPTPTPTPGAFIRSNATNTLNFINSDLSSPITLSMDQAGTITDGNLNFQGGNLTLSSGVGSGRIQVAGAASPETVAYLSDITGGGGGVQTVTAGSPNIVIGGTATNPTVDLNTAPSVLGLTSTGTGPNRFNGSVFAPSLVAQQSPISPTGLGVAIINTAASVANVVSSDATTPCQLRVQGTLQLAPGTSTATLSTTNSNLRVNNVNVLTATTGVQFNVSTATVAPGTITLTAADFYQTRLYDLNATGTLTINLPNVSSGTVPIGSYINIGRAVNDTTPGASIVVQQSFTAPSITISNANQIVQFILTGYSSTTPLYSCIGGF
jgi:hypothetical protein